MRYFRLTRENFMRPCSDHTKPCDIQQKHPHYKMSPSRQFSRKSSRLSHLFLLLQHSKFKNRIKTKTVWAATQLKNDQIFMTSFMDDPETSFYLRDVRLRLELSSGFRSVRGQQRYPSQVVPF
jgi:hypothetical protein